MITKETLDKLYGEYLAGVRRESKKGAMDEPLPKAAWASEFNLVVSDEYGGTGRYSMTQLRRANNIMVRSSKQQLSRKQRNALSKNLMGSNWREQILNSDELGISVEDIPAIEEALAQMGWNENMTEAELRRFFNFHGKDFQQWLEDYGFSSWWIFFNS